MPRKDIIHDAVKNALVKDGWTVTDDPYRIEFADVDLYADLRVEKWEAEQNPRRALVIEIKGFSGLSPMHSLENALGQYELYRDYMDEVAPGEKLYLAISDIVYNRLFTRRSFSYIVDKRKLPLLIVNIALEEVIQWIN